MHGTGQSTVRRAIIDPVFYIIAMTSILCALLISFRDSQVGFTNYRFMIWNLFLAWLPLGCSMAALVWARLARGASLAIGLIVCGVAWLLLFPNAPYLMTDFIHLIFANSYINYDVDGLLLWFDLVLYFLFIWCGLLLGYASMNQIHAIVRHYWNAVGGWVFVLASSMLGGFGVYLGRIVRLNSWDVLHPGRIIEQIIDAIHFNSIAFSILFGTLILIVYMSLYVLSGHWRGLHSSSQASQSSMHSSSH
jgi:uncharacterized membrane protein